MKEFKLIESKCLAVISLIVFAVLGSCVGSESNSDLGETTEVDSLKIRDVSTFASIYSYNGGLVANQAYKTYENSFEWVSGEELCANDYFSVRIKKKASAIIVEIDVDQELLKPYPVVYNKSFSKQEVAESLKMKVSVSNNQNKSTFELEEISNMAFGTLHKFQFVVSPADYKKIKPGMTKFNFDVDTELMTFFSLTSNKHPVKAQFQCDFQVPTVCKSVLYFKSLQLNHEVTKSILGDNDWGNAAPETGIKIECNGIQILYDFTKNSYSHNKPRSVEFYHMNENDLLDIQILDVDYGFNANDVINDTTISLRNLEGKTYYNLKMHAVDQLQIYTQFKGKSN